MCRLPKHSFIGVAGLTYYNILAGILRGLGDSATALLFLLISTVLNVVLDIWFVAGLNMGVAGVAGYCHCSRSVSIIMYY